MPPLKITDVEELNAPISYWQAVTPVDLDSLNMPKEPQNLFDILVQVTGTGNLGSVTKLKLKISPLDFPLNHIGIYLPILKELDLTGSDICSLRELGSDLENLEILRIDKCLLPSLDGILNMRCIKELHASFNRILSLGCLGSLKNLIHLNLSRNYIADLTQLTFLKPCISLQTLYLAENPCSEIKEYREQVASTLPNVAIIDGISACVTESISRNEDLKLDMNNHEDKMCLTSGGFLCGNLSRSLGRQKSSKNKGNIENEDYLEFQNTSQEKGCIGDKTAVMFGAAKGWKEAFRKIKLKNTNA